MPPLTSRFLKRRMRSLAGWQSTLACRQAVPVYKWCWVTPGEQSRVISRECRRSNPVGGFKAMAEKSEKCRAPAGNAILEDPPNGNKFVHVG